MSLSRSHDWLARRSAIATALSLTVACSPGDDLDGSSVHEARMAAMFEDLRDRAGDLEALVALMPKGGDLHSHTSGAITTEKLIQWGSEDGACVNPTTLVASNPCAAGSVPLSTATPGSQLYQQVLGAWSMEGFTGPLLAAHQHFFDSFGKFGAVQITSRNDDSLADVLASAGRHKNMYVELLQGFGSGAGSGIANSVFLPTDTWDEATLLARRQQIVSHPNFAPAIAAQKASIAATFAGARELLGCNTSSPDPGCDVEVRLQVAANRTGTRVAVFGQWVYAYELAQVVPEMAGVNLVSPEEHANSLQYYNDEMFALGVLGRWNDSMAGRKKVHVSLHAGELIPSVVPDPIHLTFHIKRAVEVAGAERIGHGVDILGETEGDGPDALMRRMSDAHVMVEICLTSNRVLLDAAGEDHPLSRYRREKVPVALATDDQGIFRGNMSDEFVAAVVDQGLGYRELKEMTRASIEHSFAEGASLWQTRDKFNRTVDDCHHDELGAATPSSTCAAFLAANRRAALQWRLEGQLAAFEAGQ